jgi:serine O-acetyltransferase
LKVHRYLTFLPSYLTIHVMEINKWMNNSLPGLVEEIRSRIETGHHIENCNYLGLAGRKEIYEILDHLLSVLFPGRYSKDSVPKDDLSFYIHDVLRHISFKFSRHLKDAFHHFCRKRTPACDTKDCDNCAYESLTYLIESIPDIRDVLQQDIEAAYFGDPAANSIEEIILSYPAIDAIATYRIAHLLYQKDVPVVPRILSERAHSLTGIDIHPGAAIGPGFFIDHGTGVVIGETCSIGKNVKIYQGVTLGALSPFDKDGNPRKGEKRHPDIEDDVIIYANATILGGKTVIGKGAIIGGNTWITASVKPGTLVYRNTNVTT